MVLDEKILIPVILAVVELLKGLGLPKKLAALAAVVLGGIAGVFFIEPKDFSIGIIRGIIAGLSAAGLYSGSKNTIEQLRAKK